MFAVGHAGSPVQGLVTIPETLWELFLGVLLHGEGLQARVPILRADTRDGRTDPTPAASPA